MGKISSLPKIEGATLLSREEAKMFLSQKGRMYSQWWWLRTAAYYPVNDSCVLIDGEVCFSGAAVDFATGCVRPALKVNIENSDFKIGDTFAFGKKTFKIISNELAFCMEDIGNCSFRKDYMADSANDYEKSDIKKFVDSWFKKATKEMGSEAQECKRKKL